MGDAWDGTPEVAGEWGEVSLVIDTDTFAGAFERELLAVCTGVLTEYPTEEAEAAAAAYDGPDLGDLVGYTLNDTDDVPSTDRCVIYPTPGWGNDGNGDHARLTSESRGTHTFPAYMSVRIPISEEPDAETLAGIKRRALAWAERESVKVEGFRLVRERTMAQSRAV